MVVKKSPGTKIIPLGCQVGGDFIRGCATYFGWTRDLAFLRQNLNRMRTALRHVMTEHQALEKKAVLTTWVWHDGRSGLKRSRAFCRPGNRRHRQEGALISMDFSRGSSVYWPELDPSNRVDAGGCLVVGSRVVLGHEKSLYGGDPARRQVVDRVD